MKYGPIDVRVKKVGKPRPHDALTVQRFDVTLTEGGFSFTLRVPVVYEDAEASIIHRMAAWRAIDEMWAAYRDPELYEESAREYRERTRTEAQRVVWAAAAFGDLLGAAWGEAVEETQRLMEALDYGESPKHWIPGNGHMNG